MTNWDRDWQFFENAAGSLEDYLLSDQLFWPLYSGKRLTLGNLRLAQSKLSVVMLPDDIQAKRTEQDRVVEDIFLKWRTNWSNKAEMEYRARLRQWEQALREITSNKQHHGLTYSHEVSTRVLLELLKNDLLQPLQEEYHQLQSMDTRLKTLVKKDDFIWDSGIKEAFPEEDYWYLYVRLKH